MLGEQRQALRLERRGEGLMPRLEAGDRGEEAERAAAGGEEQRAVGGGDLAGIVAPHVGDDEDPGLRLVVEGRRDAGAPGRPLEMARTGAGLGGEPVAEPVAGAA